MDKMPRDIPNESQANFCNSSSSIFHHFNDFCKHFSSMSPRNDNFLWQCWLSFMKFLKYNKNAWKMSRKLWIRFIALHFALLFPDFWHFTVKIVHERFMSFLNLFCCFCGFEIFLNDEFWFWGFISLTWWALINLFYFIFPVH